MHETELELEPNEASDLCRLEPPGMLDRRGWDRAFLTVLDELPAEECLAVLGHEAGAKPWKKWEAFHVSCRLDGGEGETRDGEACAQRAGRLYAFGSQFGPKDGPLDPDRAWIARVQEGDVEEAIGDGKATLELAQLNFSLHRAVNDALAAAPIELLELDPKVREAFIDAAIEEGEREGAPWAGRILPTDQPLNIEGAAFREDGRLLLGLRYPASAEGHALLVEVDEIDVVFAGDAPRCTAVWVLQAEGTPEEPLGVRALHSGDGSRFDAVIGDVDVAGGGRDTRAESSHVRFELPATGGEGPVDARTVHELGDLHRVEGVATAADGHVHYVVDHEGAVSLHTLLIDP